MAKFTSIDDYISTFPPVVQSILEQVRQAIHRAVPGGGETISYQMPTITLDDQRLIHFAGWKDHISVYPMPSGDEAMDRELEAYASGKGTVKFPLGEAIPYDLIGRMAVQLAAQRSATTT